MKFLKITFLLFLPLFSFGQQLEGTVIYEQTIDLHRNLTGERERFKNFVPKSSSTQFELKFNGAASMFKAFVDEENDPGPGSGRGRRFRFFGAGAEGDMYRNFTEKRFVSSREFEGKKYLIKGEIEQTPWKITGKSREIAGLPCMQAIYDDTLEQKQLTAWFTPAIPVPAGPSTYGQLPGLIIALDINDGEIVFRPIKIEKDVPKEKDLNEPRKGKEISNEEFKTMLETRMKEMREQREKEGGARRERGN